MIDCKNLIHPFKNDPGTSQRNRVDPELLSSKTLIDNRTLADLLNYFAQLSQHVQYYDENLKISDWQSFFSSSFPSLNEIPFFSKYLSVTSDFS